MIQPTFSVGHLPKSSLLTPNIPHFLFLKVQKHLTAKRLWNGLCFFIIFNFIGRTDVEAEIPILWPPDAKSWLIWKDPDVGNCGQEEKGTTEDEMVGWHHWLNVHGFGWTPGVGDGQGGLVCCMQSMGSQRVWHNWATELNWTEFLLLLFIILFKVHLLIYDIHLEFSFPFYSVFSFFSYFHLFHPPKPQWNL